MAALTQLYYGDWANVPDLILVQVFSYLSWEQISLSGAACKNWLRCSKAPELWRYMHFDFNSDIHRKWVQVCELYGRFCHFMLLDLPEDPEEVEYRNSVISVLELISSWESIRLSSLSFGSGYAYPQLHDDDDFFTALEKLLTKIGEKKEQSTLKTLNIGGLLGQSNDCIDKISANCPNLECLKILNEELPCRYSPSSIMNLVLQCNRLQELHLTYSSLSDHVLNALARTDRTPLKKMKIVCFGERENYGRGLSSKAWSSLRSANPVLKVHLIFHNTCPGHYVLEIMIPEIPVQELNFRNIVAHQQINAAANYGDTLEKLFIESRMFSQCKSLLNLARRCRKLSTLHVKVTLCIDVIDKILELSPLLRETGDYQLLTNSVYESSEDDFYWQRLMVK